MAGGEAQLYGADHRGMGRTATQLESRRHKFSETGYVASAIRLDARSVSGLRTALDTFVADAKPGRSGNQIISQVGDVQSNPGWKINNLWETCPEFRKLAGDAEILEEIALLTGARKIRLWRDQLLMKQRGANSDVKWHQDAHWWSILTPATQITAWVALDPVAVENGCMQMVAGSHRSGLQTALINQINCGHEPLAGLAGDRIVEDIELPLGGIHYHHCLTWHASHANASQTSRAAYAIHYMIDDTYRVAGGTHPIAESLSVDENGRVCGEAFPLLWSAGDLPS